ncbi:nucleotidyltransferase family protein [Flavobacterium undicola]|uniref:nucleotidyltransferase family protein n=1 Tax=Flavobacterium undicola TaxID=1932779 RepID=UPI00137777F3|nr:nucleotidyltransferase family protein [Flavobacterium undicola]MBA0885477.1 nucleotidyltransferase family protein [Flavobacterium undicola]
MDLLSTKYKTELINIIEKDALIMETLAIVKELNLNDCWIGAGFIRNAVWDSLHQIKTTKCNDIDVVFFDATTLSETLEKEIEAKLTQINPKAKWSVKNQARMHIRNNHQQYSNTENAISYWPETATAIAARLNSDDTIEILTPHGLNDLFNLVVAPTPNFDWNMFQQRIKKKQWEKQWENLKVIQTKTETK